MGQAQRADHHLPASVSTADRLVATEALPVPAEIAALIGAPGVARGQWVMCTGPGALSLGVVMGAAAVAGGSWMAILGLPPLGADALCELGVDLGRVVAVEADPSRPREWAERMVVCAEGCEVVLTSAPPGVPDSLWRSLSARIRRHGAVVIAVAPPALGRAPGAPPADLRCRVLEDHWEGLGCGRGRLAVRRLYVEVLGRRHPRARSGWVRVPASDSDAGDGLL